MNAQPSPAGQSPRPPFLPPFRHDHFAEAVRQPDLDLRPWAAYTLGREVQLAPVWQWLLFNGAWTGLPTENGVPAAAYYLRYACDFLIDEIPEAVFRELRGVLDRIE